MKKLLLFLLPLIFFTNVYAEELDYSISVGLGSDNLNTFSWFSQPSGNAQVIFNMSYSGTDGNAPFNEWVYVTVFYLSNAGSTWSGGYAPSMYSSYIKNFKHVDSNYIMKYPNNSGTGKVYGSCWQVYLGAEGAGDFSGYWTTYTPAGSYALVNIVVDNSSCADINRYNEYTMYYQNQQIINQNNTIISGQNTINNSVNNVDNTINNSNVDNPNNALSSLNSYLATNSTISNLITLPITLFQKVLSSLNGTCSSYDLGEYKGTHIILPCINISNYIGATLFNVIDVLISGLLIYKMSRKFIAVFHNLSSMKEGDVISD